MHEKALDECSYPHNYITPGQTEEPESLTFTPQCLIHLEREGIQRQIIIYHALKIHTSLQKMASMLPHGLEVS